MNARRLWCPLLTLTLAALGGCEFPPNTVTQLQKTLDREYSGGCVADTGNATQFVTWMIGYQSVAAAGNLEAVRLIEGSSEDLYSITIPGVPIAMDKCLDPSDPTSATVTVLTSDGNVYLVSVVSGTVTPLGLTGMLVPSGIKFIRGDDDQKDILAWGEPVGPTPTSKLFKEQANGSYLQISTPAGLGAPVAAAPIDADGDQYGDAVVGTSAASNNLRVLTNTDDSLEIANSYTVDQTIVDIVPFDFDGDTIEDALVLSSSPLVSGKAWIWLNNGDGTLTLSDSAEVGSGPVTAAVGDVNDDGMPDVAAVNGSDDTITLLFGAPGAAFGDSSTHLAPDGTFAAYFADLDEDGNTDLGVVSGFERVGVAYFGDGTDILSEEFVQLLDSITAVDFVADEFDPAFDGVYQLAALMVPADTGTLPYDLYTIPWDALEGSFADPSAPISWNVSGELTSADLNGDTAPDLMAASPIGGAEVMLNDGLGGFTPQTKTIDTGFQIVRGIVLVAIDANASVDALVSAGNELSVWFNAGDGTFTAGPTASAPGLSLSFGIDADGTIRMCTAHPVQDFATFWTVAPDGTLTQTDTVSTAPIEDISSIASGDWNSDGDADFVAVHADDPAADVHLTVFQSDGAGQYSAIPLFSGTRADGWGLEEAAFSDLDGDGFPEVIFVNNGFGTPFQFLGVIEHAGGSRGLPAPVEHYLAGEPGGGVAVVDLSGDGRPWIVTGKSGNRAGLSALPTLPATPSGCNPADLDANGVLNLDDLDTFVAAFLGGDLLADLDSNGTLNLDDLDAFVAAFLAGCP